MKQSTKSTSTKGRSGENAVSGFSRLELLAIGLGTALLMVLAVPYAAGRDRDAGARCLANQRALVMAFLLYAEDHDGRIFWNWEAYGGGFWPGPQPHLEFGITRQEAEARVEAGLRLGAYWPYLPEVAAYRCPDDLRPKLNEPGRGWAGDSYSKAGGLGTEWNVRPLRTIAAVPEPHRAMAFVEESDPRGFNNGHWVLNISPPGWVNPLAVNHDGGSTFGFVDGHAEMRHWRDPATLDAARASAQGVQAFYWGGGHLDNPDFRWVHARYKYEGWTPVGD